MVLLFTGWGEEKCEINYKKKEKNFSPSGIFFTIFGRYFAEKDDWK